MEFSSSQPNNPAARSVPPPHSPSEPGSDIVIRTMASDLAALATSGGLSPGGEHIAMRPPNADDANAKRTNTHELIAATHLRNNPGVSEKSGSWIHILIVIAGVAFLALVGYTLYRFLG